MSLYFDPLPYFKSYTWNTDQGRFYSFDDWGERPLYPSITTVLSTRDKTHLVAWEKRVGKLEADRIRNKSTKHGSHLHALVEAYIRKQKPPEPRTMFDKPRLVKLHQKFLKHVGRVYLIEASVFSDRTRVAGRLDICAKYKKRPAIIDIKTSMKPKKREWIVHYFQQAAWYATAVNELYSRDQIEPIEDIVIAMLVGGISDTGEEYVEVYEEKVSTYAPQIEAFIAEYHEKYTIPLQSNVLPVA